MAQTIMEVNGKRYHVVPDNPNDKDYLPCSDCDLVKWCNVMDGVAFCAEYLFKVHFEEEKV